MSETLDYPEAGSYAQEDYDTEHAESFQERSAEQSYQQEAGRDAYERGQQEKIEEKVREAVYEATTDAPTTQQSILEKLGLDWVTTESFCAWNYLTISLTAVLVLILVYVLYKLVGPKSRRDRSKEAKKKFKQQQNETAEGKKKI